MKHWKIKGSVLLFALLMVLSFFSKTIYISRLPRVKGQLPKKGALEKSYHTSGVASYGEEQWIYLPVTGKIDTLHVALGDSVRTGDLLASMDYDTSEADNQLSKNYYSGEETSNSIKGVDLDILQLEREISYLENPEASPADTDNQHQLDLLRLDIRAASSNLKEQRKLHEAGEIEDSVLERARLDLQKLYLQEEGLEEKIVREKEKKVKDLAKEEKDHEKLLLDKKDQLEKLLLQQAQHELSLSSLGLDNQSVNEALAEFKVNDQIKSPIEGTITKLEAGLGETVNKTQKLLGIGVADSLELQVDIPLDNDFIKVGDWAKIHNANHMMEGQVKYIQVSPDGKKAFISLPKEKATQGESFSVEFEKQSETTYHLVPNSAIGKDKKGYFVNYIRQRDGLLGSEYYLAQIRVEIGEQDETNTAILKGISFYEPVATESNKATESGDSVFLENEKEFFDEKK